MNHTICIDTAAEINRHHELACKRADEAINHAVEAGKLLLEVKASLGHGQFTAWIGKNLAVSARQVQRYISAAQGKPAAIRAPSAKPTPMSLLNGEPATAENNWTPKPAFLPVQGNWYWVVVEGMGSFVVEPSSAHPGFFFASHILPDGDTYDCTARPISAIWIESYLQAEGLKRPAAVEWLIRPSAGVRIALETLNSVETTEARLAHKETIEEAIARMKRSNEAGRGGRPAMANAIAVPHGLPSVGDGKTESTDAGGAGAHNNSAPGAEFRGAAC